MIIISRHRLHVLPVVGIAVAIALAAFLAVRLAGGLGETRPRSTPSATVGAASEKPAAQPKERVRYQATIENWRRYRATNPPD